MKKINLETAFEMLCNQGFEVEIEDLSFLDKKIENDLLELRNSRGITLATVTTEIGISISALSKMENGVTPITPNMAEKLSKYYGVDIKAEKFPYQDTIQKLKLELAKEKAHNKILVKENEEYKGVFLNLEHTAKFIQKQIKQIK